MHERELFETYRKDVYHTCYFMLHNPADAEDVCQDIFIAVFRQDWRQVKFMRTWIMRVTVNHCLNHLKKKGRMKRKEDRFRLHLPRGAEKAAEAVAEEQESMRECAGLLRTLPAKLRAAVSLRYLNEYSLSEIADILDIPVGTVKSRLNKGLKLIKKALETGELERSGEHEPYGTNLYPVSKR